MSIYFARGAIIQSFWKMWSCRKDRRRSGLNIGGRWVRIEKTVNWKPRNVET